MDSNEIQVGAGNINYILKNQSSKFAELETLIGWLGHVTFIVPYAKHFMSRLRSSLHTAKHKRSAKIPTEIANDLNFHIEILDLARKGMSMNLLRYRKADILYRANTCPTGLGSYSARGRARHFMIPINLQLRATQNMLEHLLLFRKSIYRVTK